MSKPSRTDRAPGPAAPSAPRVGEPIAVVGLGCRFPGARGPDAYWRLLVEGGEAIREIPRERFDVDRYYDPELSDPQSMNTRWAGLIDDVDAFDAEFFGISSAEARTMDPQQRITLETAWEALEDAGLDPRHLDVASSGVFIGASTLDYQALHRYAPPRGGTGITASIIANRVSFLLDLHGPSMAIDSACSSSLVAVDLAVTSLRAGSCDVAIAGGVNAILSPQWGITFAQAGIMASDGRCKSFDARADGFVRAEGSGVVVLRRLSDALAAGDRIRALILGGATNQDGRSAGLTAPSADAQVALVRAALARAGVAPAEVGFVEAHATGTALGDATEVSALARSLADGRAPGATAWLGAVKTNIGHLEAAAGIAGLIKTVLVLEHGWIPPHRQLRELNPKLKLDAGCLGIAREGRAWPRAAARRVAGVSSFGIGGTNAHIVLAEAPEPAERTLAAPIVSVVPLAARSRERLGALAAAWRASPIVDAPLAEVSVAAGVGRDHPAQARAAILVDDQAGLATALDALAAGTDAPGISVGTPERLPRVAFLFTGQGAQWAGMGKGLLDVDPTFTRVIDRCDAAFAPAISLRALLARGDELTTAPTIQPALFSVEVALAEMWRSWGVEPVAVLGHSLGELAAAVIAGAVELEPACALVATRARLMDALPSHGGMATIFCDAARVEEELARLDLGLVVAAINAPRVTVIAGPRAALETALDRFDEVDVQGRALHVSHAFHSPLMEPVLDEFAAAVAAAGFRAPTMPFVANLTGAVTSSLDQAYWRRQLREPVRFLDGLRALATLGCDLLLEVGPAPVLVDLAKRTFSGEGPRLASSLARDLPPARTLGAAVATLYAQGAPLAWRAIHAGRRAAWVGLPTYPFERRRHWLTPDELRPDA